MLTDKAIQAAKPKARPYKLADGEGLTLLVKPIGSKLWRFRYRHEGREKMLGFGSYPDTSAKLAREKREQARKLLAQGLDPSGTRQAEKAARNNTFEAIAREWLTLQQERLAPATYAKAVWTLETLVFPHLGTRPIDKITAADVLRVLKRIEGRGLRETAHRTRQRK
jgi:Arm DNA-binding domain/Phage integrase central domain